METLEVGQPYLPNGKKLPPCTEYAYRDGGHELRLVLPQLTAYETGGILEGECEFAVAVEEGVIFFLYRFGPPPQHPMAHSKGDAIRWSNAPYSWHLEPEERRRLPDPEPLETERALLQIYLVSAEDGILRGIRAASLSPETTRTLHTAIREQVAAGDPGRAAHAAAIARVYARYPSSAQLLDKALARTKGGA